MASKYKCCIEQFQNTEPNEFFTWGHHELNILTREMAHANNNGYNRILRYIEAYAYWSIDDRCWNVREYQKRGMKPITLIVAKCSEQNGDE